MSHFTPGVAKGFQNLPDLLKLPLSRQILAVPIERKELICRFMIKIQSGNKGREDLPDLLSIFPPCRLQQQIIQLDDQLNRGSIRSEEHTSELQSRGHLVCRLLLEKKKNT